jgi:hypothetical protein
MGAWRRLACSAHADSAASSRHKKKLAVLVLSNCGMMDMGVFEFHHPSNPMIIKPTGWNSFFFC